MEIWLIILLGAAGVIIVNLINKRKPVYKIGGTIAIILACVLGLLLYYFLSYTENVETVLMTLGLSVAMLILIYVLIVVAGNYYENRKLQKLQSMETDALTEQLMDALSKNSSRKGRKASRKSASEEWQDEMMTVSELEHRMAAGNGGEPQDAGEIVLEEQQEYEVEAEGFYAAEEISGEAGEALESYEEEEAELYVQEDGMETGPQSVLEAGPEEPAYGEQPESTFEEWKPEVLEDMSVVINRGGEDEDTEKPDMEKLDVDKFETEEMSGSETVEEWQPDTDVEQRLRIQRDSAREESAAELDEWQVDSVMPGDWEDEEEPIYDDVESAYGEDGEEFEPVEFVSAFNRRSGAGAETPEPAFEYESGGEAAGFSEEEAMEWVSTFREGRDEEEPEPETGEKVAEAVAFVEELIAEEPEQTGSAVFAAEEIVLQEPEQPETAEQDMLIASETVEEAAAYEPEPAIEEPAAEVEGEEEADMWMSAIEEEYEPEAAEAEEVALEQAEPEEAVTVADTEPSEEGGDAVMWTDFLGEEFAEEEPETGEEPAAVREESYEAEEWTPAQYEEPEAQLAPEAEAETAGAEEILPEPAAAETPAPEDEAVDPENEKKERMAGLKKLVVSKEYGEALKKVFEILNAGYSMTLDEKQQMKIIMLTLRDKTK